MTDSESRSYFCPAPTPISTTVLLAAAKQAASPESRYGIGNHLKRPEIASGLQHFAWLLALLRVGG
ncbi:hypothetical protein [Methylomonas koyamae]|uniref:hypothetical protein n=1 Tax=Methylomonas koyamae TaxID=702114 RepID=UPI00112AEA9B|nr:hypothetical protein [Methylomonas koyamae]TPQ24683.1 hypothetical protein C2U68_18570 [Methylomonas koyamae]